MRTLLSGKKVPEAKTPVKTFFDTMCPEKWVHVDCEGGHIYVPVDNGPDKSHFKSATLDQLEAAKIAIEREIAFKKSELKKNLRSGRN